MCAQRAFLRELKRIAGDKVVIAGSRGLKFFLEREGKDVRWRCSDIDVYIECDEDTFATWHEFGPL